MNPFKGRHLQRDLTLWAARPHRKYATRYREPPDIHRHHSSAYPARARQGCGELQSRPVEVISSMHNQQRIKYAQEQEHPSH